MVSTNETSIHLWKVPKKNKNRPSKDFLVKTIYDITGESLDLRPLNIDELVTLADWFSNPTQYESILPVYTTKKPMVEYISTLCPKVVNTGRLPVSVLQKLCGVMHECANKK